MPLPICLRLCLALLLAPLSSSIALADEAPVVVPSFAPPLAPLRPPSVGSPFALRLAVDLPITVGAALAAIFSEVVKSELPGPSCGTPCDPANINALDRLSIGSHSAAARTASDVLVGLNIGLPLIFDLIDVAAHRPADGFAGYGRDVLVLAEVFAVDAGLNAVFKYAVRRPRPLVYDPDPSAFSAAERSAPDSALSFYSEHSSLSFALATSYSYLFMKRHPQSPLVVPVWLLTEGLAATTASLRVVAGKHFISDVLTGAAVGAALGFLIPFLHDQLLPSSVSFDGSRLELRATPLISAGGGGVLLTLH
jgi:membrane-associated phospholipid phosphatase